MTPVLRPARFAAVALSMTLLAACGGGGGDDPPPPPPPPPNQGPTASFTATPLQGGAPLMVRLDASASTDSDGTIIGFVWDFGDDAGLAVGQSVAHTYTEVGTYTIRLTVRDNDGDSAAASRNVTVDAPAGQFTLSGTVRILPSSAIDSDVNDLSTGPGFFDTVKPNNTFADAQPIPNPVALGGFANIAGAGATGGVSTVTGDVRDIYRVNLAGGENIRLTIAESAATDLDLYLHDVAQMLIDASMGTGNTESIEVPGVAGEYFVEVRAEAGASNYVLNIGQDLGATAAAVIGARLRLGDDFVPGELIVATSESLARLDLVETGRAGRARLAALPHGRFAGGGPGHPAGARMPSRLEAKYRTLRRIKALRRRADVRYAEPNYLRQPLRTPNDEFYHLQWHLETINLPTAWDLTTGDADVIVAIIDTGILLDHPDLANQVIAGFDFISDPARSNDGDGIDPDPYDAGDLALGASSSYHGTHVGGIVASQTDNVTGVAGVSWDTRLMPLRVLGIDGGTSLDLMQALRFAAGLSSNAPPAPRAADIINMSIGGPSSSQFEQDTIDAVRAAGLIMVAAAGNESSSQPSFPAAYDGVVSVSATTITNALAPYSNFGVTIDVAAPGGNLGTDFNGDGLADGVVSALGEDVDNGIRFGYAALQGTSMATPHVAGVAALMKAVYPNLTPAEFDQALASGALTKDLGEPGRDNLFGHGLIDAQKAVLEAMRLADGGGAPPPPVLDATPGSVNFGAFQELFEVVIGNAGAGTLTVTGTSTNQPWLAVAAGTDVGADGLGTYELTVNRFGLAEGAYSGEVVFTSSANDVNVSAVMQVSPVDINADAGLHYIILVDPATNAVVGPNGQDEVLAQNGEYEYTFEQISAGQYRIFAGTDSDNDGFLCDAGEACGAFPTLDSPAFVNINGDRAGLDFLSGFSVNLFNLNAAGAARTPLPAEGFPIHKVPAASP